MHCYVALSRGVGTGPAGPATAGPMFPEPTIKNIIPLFVIKQIKNFYITAAYLYHFNKGCTIILLKEQDTNLLQAKLCYKLSACKIILDR